MVVRRPDLKSNNARRWQSGPDLSVSIGYLRAILAHLEEIDVRMYRISSGFVPYATHPEMPRFHGQIRECASELSEVGRWADERGIRLSLHPSQFVLLNALDPAITDKGIANVNAQVELLDALEQGSESVVVIPLGGAYGDKAAAMQRFAANFPRLAEAGRRRLAIENGEKIYTVEDCLRVHEATGLPVIFDHQHHLLNPGSLSVGKAAQAAPRTWPAEVVPKVHFSSPRLDSRLVKRGKKEVEAPPLLSQHADYIHPWEFAGFLEQAGDGIFDVMLEAKMKDAALLKLRSDLRRLGLAEEIERATSASG
jgi:UV DNA damage endonuclease